MPRRRPSGRGSTYQDKAGRWIAQLYIQGRKVRRIAHTQEEAEVLLDRLRDERDAGVISSLDTVAKFLTRWLEGKRAEGVRAGTLQGYESKIRTYIRPAIGHVQLGKLTPLRVQRMLDEMRGRKGRRLSAATIGQTRRVLHSALADAERLMAVERNAVTRTKAPRAQRRERRTFTPEQAVTFLDSLTGDRQEPLYNLVCTLGLRQSEVLGLRWQDVDADVIRIVQTTQRVPGSYVIEGTKSPRSARTIPLPAFVSALMDAQRTRQREEYVATGARPDHDLAFTRTNGQPVNGSSLSHSFKDRIGALSLPAITFHDLRHCAASLLQSHGFSAREIQDVLGHANYATTMDIYTHVPPEELAAKMKRLDSWRFGSS